VKRVLLAGVGTLVAASALLYWTRPERRGTLPVLTWVTTDDPVKRETAALFRTWRAAQGLPPCEVQIDHASGMSSSGTAPPKVLIQGIVGLGGDLMDVTYLELFQKTGMLTDLTAAARRGGFGVDRTYPAIRGDFLIGGRQYGFPRNVDAEMLWVNRDTFKRYGIPEPSTRWDWDQFEQLGRRFVAAANPPGSRHRVFFLSSLEPVVIRRGLGLATFNETMTRCTLDDPRNVEVMRRLYRWTIEERLMPTETEQRELASADTTELNGAFSGLASGQFGMINSYLWALIELRLMGNLNLKVVEPFNSGFPNTQVGGGSVTVFARSRHPELAFDFLRFLTSESFNLLVIHSGDGLPPVPAYARTDAFLHPPGHPGERGAQAAFLKAATEIGIAASKSPFVLSSIVQRVDIEEMEAMLANRLSPAEAARVTAQRINDEIAVTLREDGALAQLYAARQETQRQIDARRAVGRPVPAAWISDPFLLAYYRAHGWLEKEVAP
jgi:multiple sugar transport system substrate-binding protein